MLMEPLRAPADHDSVQALIRSWSGAAVERFIDDLAADGAASEFDPPLGRVILSGKTAAEESTAAAVILIGRRPPEEGRVRAKLADEPFAVEIPARMLQALTPDALLYRDRRLFDIEPATVYRMALSRGDVEQALRRHRGFRRLGPGRRAAHSRTGRGRGFCLQRQRRPARRSQYRG